MKLRLLRYLMNHPLNRRMRFKAALNIARWKIATRLLPGSEVILPFVNDSKIIAIPGRWGTEANALCGMHDFSDMGFLLHLLRPTDLFCDVGANVGEYTVLASAAIGARSVAFEPIESSYMELRKNMEINLAAPLVDTRCMAIGSKRGHLTMTSDRDTQNHVVVNQEARAIESIAVDTLDNVLAGTSPTLMKVDVEGWEHEVFKGAENTLGCTTLMAIIVELNQSGDRYGFSDDSVHKILLDHDFSTYHYLPFERRLFDLGGKHNNGGNMLYIRNLEVVAERLRTAPPFNVRNLQI